MRTIISTVGTSLISNAARRAAAEPAAAHDLVRILADADPAKACAESHVLAKLDLQPDDRLVFLHTQTEDGERCAQALKSHYASSVAGVEMRCIDHLTYEDRSFKQRGIKQLVDALADILGRERRAGREVLINATGGFKAEIAYATLVGLLFKAPVVYMHERFQDLVTLPPIPVQWDFSLFALHREFFEWLDQEPRPCGAIRRRSRALPHELKLLVDENWGDGAGGLNAAGEALRVALTALEATAAKSRVTLSTTASASLGAMDPSTRQGFEDLLRNLEARDLWLQQSDWVESGEMRVYPRGHRDERIIFYENGDEIRVCELVRHADKSYERLLARGVKRKDYGFH